MGSEMCIRDSSSTSKGTQETVGLPVGPEVGDPVGVPGVTVGLPVGPAVGDPVGDPGLTVGLPVGPAVGWSVAPHGYLALILRLSTPAVKSAMLVVLSTWNLRLIVFAGNKLASSTVNCTLNFLS